MILLTLERKYLKVEQSFAQSSFHIKSLLSLCGLDGGAQWMSRYTNYASLQPAAGLRIFTSSYPHVTHLLFTATKITKQQDKTSINYLTG